ncbi:unnamed protein product [Caenorhabditis angaria]|uniref:F-box domain-containing protein n=1 Tax=Caenorhabditis angaria TaxID=860376 RepID=A0A9P1IHL5_9PELO|nr:unnamed protein product [Caenorhabditis angaria]
MGTCCSRKENSKEYSGGIGWFDLPYDMRRIIIDLMDLEAKARFFWCSRDCGEEVSQSRNYIRKIYMKRGEKNGEILIFVYGNGGKWMFRVKELEESTEVSWEMNEKIISIDKFENWKSIDVVLKYFNDVLKKNSRSLTDIEIYIYDFPYDRTNMNILKNRNLEKLSLRINKNDEIDPISCGFIDFATLSRFNTKIKIPKLKLVDFVKIKSSKLVVHRPRFFLDEFDAFLQNVLYDEALDDNLKLVEFKLFRISRRTIEFFLMPTIQQYITRCAVKYTELGVLDTFLFMGTSKYRLHSFKLKNNVLIYSNEKNPIGI